MEFDKSRGYTGLNADELKPGSKVIFADSMGTLKRYVANGNFIETLTAVLNKEEVRRFQSDTTAYNLAYLVEEPQYLKWTDLKIGGYN